MLGIFIGTLIAELIARRFFNVQGQLFEYNPSTGYITKPNRSFESKTPEFMVHYETNDLGLRGPDINVENLGDCTILGLGDSFTFGMGVEYEETYLEVMRRALLNPPHENFGVINAGQGGWGTAQQAVFLEENIAVFHPRLIIVGVYQNDITDNISPNLFEITADQHLERTGIVPKSRIDEVRELADSVPLYAWLSENSALFGLLRVFVQNIFTRPTATPAAVDTTNPQPAVATSQETEKYLINLERLLLLRIQAIALESGSQVVFVFIPQMRDKETLFVDEAVYGVCDTGGMLCIDMRDALKTSAHPLESLYYPHDRHWKPLGHLVAGTELAAYIQNQRLLECSPS